MPNVLEDSSELGKATINIRFILFSSQHNLATEPDEASRNETINMHINITHFKRVVVVNLVLILYSK